MVVMRCISMHADSNSTLFQKSEFAHKLPQSIFSVKSFFAAERDKFTQQTHKNEYLHSNYTYFTINSFQKHQYVLVCSATISNFPRFSQVSFSRFHAKNWTLSAFNKHNKCVHSFYPPYLHTVPNQKNRIKFSSKNREWHQITPCLHWLYQSFVIQRPCRLQYA